MPEAKGRNLNKTFDDEDNFIIVTRLRPRERPFVSVRQQRMTEYCMEEAVRRRRMGKLPARTLCKGGKVAPKPAVASSRKDVQKLELYGSPLSAEQVVESKEISATRLNPLMHSDDLEVLFPPRDMPDSVSDLAVMSGNSDDSLMSSPWRCLDRDAIEHAMQDRPPSVTSPERPRRPQGRCGDTGGFSETEDRYLNKPLGDGYIPSHVLNYTSDKVANSRNSRDRQTKHREIWQAMHEKLWEHERLEIVREDRSSSAKIKESVPPVDRKRGSMEKQLKFSTSNSKGIRCSNAVKYRRCSYQPSTAMPQTRAAHLYKLGRLLKGNLSPSRAIHRKVLSKDGVREVEDFSDGRHVWPRHLALMKRENKISAGQPSSLVTSMGTRGAKSSGAQRNSAISETPGGKTTESEVASSAPPTNDRQSSSQYGTASMRPNKPNFIVPVKASRIPMHVLYTKKFCGQSNERPRIPAELQSFGPRTRHDRRSSCPSLSVTNSLGEITPVPKTNETGAPFSISLGAPFSSNREHSTRPTVRFIIPEKVNSSTSSIQSQRTRVQLFDDNVNFQPTVGFLADTSTLKSLGRRMRHGTKATAGDRQSTHKPLFVAMPRSPTYFNKSSTQFITSKTIETNHRHRQSRKSAAAFVASSRHMRELPKSCPLEVSQPFRTSPFNVSTVDDKQRKAFPDYLPRSSRLCKPYIFSERERDSGNSPGTSGAVPSYNSSGSFLSFNSQGLIKNPNASGFNGATKQNSVSLTKTNNKVDKRKSYLLQLSRSWTQQSNRPPENIPTGISPNPRTSQESKHPIRFNPSVDFSRFASPPSPYPQDRSVEENGSFSPLFNTCTCVNYCTCVSTSSNMAKPLFPEGESATEFFSSSPRRRRPRTLSTFSAQVPSGALLNIPFFNECIPPSREEVSGFNETAGSHTSSIKTSTLHVAVKNQLPKDDQPPDLRIRHNKDSVSAEIVDDHQECIISDREKTRFPKTSGGQNTDLLSPVEERSSAGLGFSRDAIAGGLETFNNGEYSCCLDLNADYTEVDRGRSTSKTRIKRNGIQSAEQLQLPGMKELSALHSPLDVKLSTVTKGCSNALATSDALIRAHGNSCITEPIPPCEEARCEHSHHSQACTKAVRFSNSVEKPCFDQGAMETQPAGKTHESVEPLSQCAIIGTPPQKSSDGTPRRDHSAKCLREDACLSFNPCFQTDVEHPPSNEKLNPSESPGNAFVGVPKGFEDKSSLESTAESLRQSDILCVNYFDGAVRNSFQPDTNFDLWSPVTGQQLSHNVYSRMNSACFPSSPGGERGTSSDLNRYPDSICLWPAEESQDEQNELSRASKTLEDVSLPSVAITSNYQTYKVSAEETQYVEASTQVPAVIRRNVETTTSDSGTPMLISPLSVRQLENIIDVPPVFKETESIGTVTEDLFDGAAVCSRECKFSVPDPDTHGLTSVDRHTSRSSFNAAISPVNCLCQCISRISTEALSGHLDAIQRDGRHSDIEHLRSRRAIFKSHSTQLASVCAVAMVPLYEQAIDSGHLFDCTARMKKRSESRHAGTSGYSHHTCKHEQRGKPGRQPVHARHVFVRALRRDSDHLRYMSDSCCKSNESASVQLKQDVGSEVIRGDCEDTVHVCTPWDITTEALCYCDPYRSLGCFRPETHERDSTVHKVPGNRDVSAQADTSAAMKGKNDVESSSDDNTSVLRKCRYSKWVEKAKVRHAALSDLSVASPRQTSRTSTGISRDNSKSRDKGNLKDTNTTKARAEVDFIQNQPAAENTHLDTSSRCHKYGCTLCKKDCKSKQKKTSIFKRTGGTSEAAAAESPLPGCSSISLSVSTAREPLVRQRDHIVPLKHSGQSVKQSCCCKAQEEIHVTFSDKLSEIKNAREISAYDCFGKCRSACKKLQCLQCIKNAISAKAARRMADEKTESETHFQDIFNENFRSDFEHRKLSVILETSSIDLDRSLTGLSEEERCHVPSPEPDFDNSFEALTVVSELPCERSLPQFSLISETEVGSQEEKNGFILGFHPLHESDDDITLRKASKRLLTHDTDVDVEPTASVASAQFEDVETDYKKGCIFTAMRRYMSHRKHRRASNVEEHPCPCKRCGERVRRSDFQDSEYCGRCYDFPGPSERCYDGGDPYSPTVDFSAHPCAGCLSVIDRDDSFASYRHTSNVVGVAAINPCQCHPVLLYTVSANADPTDTAPRFQRAAQSCQSDRGYLSADQGPSNIPSTESSSDENINNASLEEFVSCFRRPKQDSSLSKIDSSSLKDTRYRGSRASVSKTEINPDGEQDILSGCPSSACLVDAFVVCHQTPRSPCRRTALPKPRRHNYEDISTHQTCHMRKLPAAQVPVLDTVPEESHVSHLHTPLQWSIVEDRRIPVPNTGPCERCVLPTSDVRPHRLMRGPQIHEHMFTAIPEREPSVSALKYCTCSSNPTGNVSHLHRRTCENGICYGTTSATFDSHRNLFSSAERNLVIERDTDANRRPRNVKRRWRQRSKRLNR